MKQSKIVCIIPARLDSKRFPRKILVDIHGKPLIWWVYQAAKKCQQLSRVYIAIDHGDTKKIVEKFCPDIIETSPHCKNGTERIIDALSKKEIDGDIILNWQADEPMINAQMIDDLFVKQESHIDIWTLRKKLHSLEEVRNPNVVKVVTNHLQLALYFSRASIPFIRDQEMMIESPYFKHVGLYAYTKKALTKIKQLEHIDLEKCEQLEQLTFLYHGMNIHVGDTLIDTIGIDTKEDLLKFVGLIQLNS
ncbi:MAG: 3-deoxy-manno-octulosonate cytidylyltransferase [Chlamydiales bacterium]|nr:3-deoxy-manno-octulosonate cytidylyltransferase [Chlamydiales bacterium]